MSVATEQKIINKHHIHMHELEESVIGVPGLKAVWHDHPQRGRRLLVEAFVRGRRVLVVLYPTDVVDEWNVGSAYFI